MPTSASLEVGQEAPDFRLKGPGGAFVTLSEYRGQQNVVLAFYPLAFSPVCAHQLPTLQRELAAARGARRRGARRSAWTATTRTRRSPQRLRLTFPLLSDFKREASAAYGVLLGAAGFSGRALFLVDKQGRVAYKEISRELQRSGAGAEQREAARRARGAAVGRPPGPRRSTRPRGRPAVMSKDPATVLVVERESDATNSLIARLRANGYRRGVGPRR